MEQHVASLRKRIEQSVVFKGLFEVNVLGFHVSPCQVNISIINGDWSRVKRNVKWTIELARIEGFVFDVAQVNESGFPLEWVDDLEQTFFFNSHALFNTKIRSKPIVDELSEVVVDLIFVFLFHLVEFEILRVLIETLLNSSIDFDEFL